MRIAGKDFVILAAIDETMTKCHKQAKAPGSTLRTDTGERPVWIIRDGRNRASTGSGPIDREGG